MQEVWKQCNNCLSQDLPDTPFKNETKRTTKKCSPGILLQMQVNVDNHNLNLQGRVIFPSLSLVGLRISLYLW